MPHDENITPQPVEPPEQVVAPPSVTQPEAPAPAAAPAPAPAPAAPVAPAAAENPWEFPRAAVLAALRAVGLGYAALLVLGLLTALALLVAGSGLPGWAVVTAPFHVAAAALGWSASLGVDMGEFGGGQAMSFATPTLLLTGLGLGVVVVVARRLRASVTRVGDRWFAAAAGGLALSIVALLFALVLPLPISVGDLGSAVTLSAAGPGVVVGGLLLGTLAVALGFAWEGPSPQLALLGVRVPGAIARAAHAMRPALGVATWHVAVVGALAGVALLITLLVNDGAQSLSVILLGATSALSAVTALAFWVPIESDVAASALVGSTDSVTVFGMDAAWVILTILVGLVVLVMTGLRLRLLRDAEPRLVPHGRVVGAYAIAGVVLSLTGWMSFSTTSMFGSSVGGLLGVATWAFVILALWGAAVEAIALFVAEPVLRAVPVLGVVAHLPTRVPAADVAAAYPPAPVAEGAVPPPPAPPAPPATPAP